MDIEAFIAKWSNCEGGAERSNAPLYLVEMLTALGLPTPDPASARTLHNDYVFERTVRLSVDEVGQPNRIDLYKRGCFVLEAKQSRWPGQAKSRPFDPAEHAADMAAASDGAGQKWDVQMRHARKQALHYVFQLPADHPTPPFILVCDVARGFEVFADFTGTGRGYTFFPDRRRFRFHHADLARPDIQEMLRAIWNNPLSLDPSRKAVAVTRGIIDELAHLSRRLEGAGHDPEDVAHFLMRCIFTVFAADVGLLPKARLTALIEDCIQNPRQFVLMFEQLWKCLDSADYDRRFFAGLGCHLPHINGDLFKDSRVLPLERDELERLLLATRHDWRLVEPAIFGTLLEHALRPADRRRLGAHYTPRRHVESLVEKTVMEPLRADWADVSMQIEQARDEGNTAVAIRLARAFHADLCAVRVLDPACGTGNFLYVCLDMMKRLEVEVLETLTQLGDTDRLDLATIDPRQFLGLEVNPRAAAIAQLVLWIGWLQQHYRNHTGHPAEPILQANGNVAHRDAVLDWDGAPRLRFTVGQGPAREQWPNPHRPTWPEAEFIVGNPPFIGGKDLRSRLDEGYAEALWRAHPQMNESADLVMYWWDMAAEILARPGSRLRRFGFVTTNSIGQTFQRRTIERWLNGERPLSLVHAVPDHPWTRVTRDSASVRIAMTVVEAGVHDGELSTVVSEADVDTDAPVITFNTARGRINSDLTLGADVTRNRPLQANAGLCSAGVKLHGAGFIVSRDQAASLGLGVRPGLENHIRPYRNGRDLTARSRDALVIDFSGLTREAVRDRFPEAYSHLAETVRDARLRQAERSPTADARAYADQWWLFGKPRTDLRATLAALPRYIATVETARHRVFQFLNAEIVPDNMLICVASDDAALLAVLSSRHHAAYALRAGGWLGIGNDPRYSKSRCFDPFPFPAMDSGLHSRLASIGEALDAHRKSVLVENADLTLTGLYNLLALSREGASFTARQRDAARRGRIVVLRDLHAEIDLLTAQAYQWPAQRSDEEVVAALAGLNRARMLEETHGRIRWLRPDQPTNRVRVGRARLDVLDLPGLHPRVPATRPAFPRNPYAQSLALKAAMNGTGPVKADDLARRFSGGARLTPRIGRVLTTLHRYGHVEQLDDGRWISASP